MAIWRQIKRSQINLLSINLKRSYFQIHTPYWMNNNMSSRFKIMVCNPPSLPPHTSQFDFPTSNLRFYAAPVKGSNKNEEKTDGPRLNEDITADVVRVVTDEGHSVMPKHRALALARSRNLDLVEVQRNATPPVCKMMDYCRERYKENLKEKDRVKKKTEPTLKTGACKEVRFAGKITQKDLQIKADMVKRLMERGYRVKCVAIGKTSKQTGKAEDSKTLLSRFLRLIEDIAVVESESIVGKKAQAQESDTRVVEKDQAQESDALVVEKDQSLIIVRHVKYGPLKKGSGKKGSTDNKLSSPVAPEGTSENDVQLGEILDEDLEKEKSEWDSFNAEGEVEEIFKLGDQQEAAKNFSIENSFSAQPEELRSSPSMSSASSSPKSELKSTSNQKASCISSGGTENRYMRDSRDRTSLRGQFNANPSFQQREAEYIVNGSPPLQNSKFLEQDPNSPRTACGISTPRRADGTLGQQSSQTVVNRYKQRNPSDSVRDTRLGGITGQPNLRFPNSRAGREEAVDKDQGRWGIFSAEGTRRVPDRKLEGQVKVQR